MMAEKKWCLVIPFNTREKAVYAARFLKDYTILEKMIKTIEIDGTEPKEEYAYLNGMVK